MPLISDFLRDHCNLTRNNNDELVKSGFLQISHIR